MLALCPLAAATLPQACPAFRLAQLHAELPITLMLGLTTNAAALSAMLPSDITDRCMQLRQFKLVRASFVCCALRNLSSGASHSWWRALMLCRIVWHWTALPGSACACARPSATPVSTLCLHLPCSCGCLFAAVPRVSCLCLRPAPWRAWTAWFGVCCWAAAVAGQVCCSGGPCLHPVQLKGLLSVRPVDCPVGGLWV